MKAKDARMRLFGRAYETVLRDDLNAGTGGNSLAAP